MVFNVRTCAETLHTRDADFLESKTRVKETTDVVGRLAMELTAMREQKGNNIKRSQTSLSEKSGSINIATSLEIAINEDYDLDALNNEDVQLDFTALLQCVHIHDVLGKKNQFKHDYEEKRKQQCEVITGTTFSLKNGDLSGFEHYIQEVAGFFVIEATIINVTQNFRSRSSVETLWGTALSRMNNHISDALRDCESPEVFMNIKVCVLAFIQTMQIYGFSSTSVADLMVSLVDRYAELNTIKCSKQLLYIIDEEDDYIPMLVQNEDELAEVSKGFSIPKELLKSSNPSQRKADGSIS